MGILQPRARFKESHGVLIVNLEHNKLRELGPLEDTFVVPLFSASYVGYRSTDLEEFFESQLEKNKRSNAMHYLLLAMSHSLEVRSKSGLPKSGLQPGDRLLRNVQHYPSIHSSYVYISSSLGSVFSLRVKNFYLNSATILYEDAPELWLIINPSSMFRLESCLTEKLQFKKPDCSQFLRHQKLIPQPSLLRE